MTIHEFGQVHDEVVVLVHPSVVMWDYFEYVIPLMQEHYHLIVPVLPGYDTESGSDFTSVEQIAEELADWLITHDHKEIACIYGCSMGGSVVTRFLADRKVKVRSAVIDGGYSFISTLAEDNKLSVRSLEVLEKNLKKRRSCMRVIEYDKKYRQDFIDFNSAWIIDNFGHLEPEDYETFEHIEEEIQDGAMIYFAVDDNGTALAACMSKPMVEDTWEICKLGSNKNVSHKGAGSAVFESAMEWATQRLKEYIIKVYTYTRVSTSIRIDGYSLDAQKSRMKAFWRESDLCGGWN